MPETKVRLLVVDDEPSIRSTMTQVLAEIGFRVRSAEDGFAALLELQQEIPDILLTDLNMPGMSGFELLTAVRQSFPSIRTIAMSGSFSGNEVPSGVAADAFFQKGSSMGALLRIIENLPRSKRLFSKVQIPLPPPQPRSRGRQSGGRKTPAAKPLPGANTIRIETSKREKGQCAISQS
jgi:CheY-like chemotaxis protein